MKTSTKIIIGVSASIGLLVYFGWQKIQKLKTVFEKINIELAGIRDLKITSQVIEFKANVKFINYTNEDFSVNGYFVKLKTLNFYYKGKFIGNANPNLVQVSVPKYNELVIENIPASVPLSSIFTNLTEIPTFNADNLTVKAIVSVANNDFLIES